jgi:hypothetical protein
MRDIRKFLGWAFLIASLVSICLTILSIERGIQMHYDFLRPRILLLEAAFPVMAVIFGMTWWTVWRDKPSARGWGAAASSIQILLPLCMIIFRSYSILGCQGVGLALGVVGLIAFSWPDKSQTATDDSEPESDPS